MKKNNIKAFTLSEVLMCLVVIGTITAITLGYAFNSNKSKAKKIHVTSKTFYSNVETIYTDVLNKYTTGYNLANLEGATSDSSENNKLVAKIFANYLDGDILDDCSDLVVAQGQTISEYKNDSLACIMLNTGIVAGFNYNENCAYTAETSNDSKSDSEESSDLSQIETIEYRKTASEAEESDFSSRTVDNTCGYIIYGFKDGTGTFGKDLFTIPLGKRGVK